ncbi:MULTISPECIES: ATP-dependent DNA ligase [Mycolicibacterium]|uniref:ATP-dependent DNA ligase n=1 Tax=Mycolicibacterium TaxID=1866885 RepID=UPI0005602A31|nr:MULTISPECIES: ATP-dependent DNA ligase [Mycolicibacterium]QZY48097.1 ATP-dependent DNA ligase [Mycolicibacterium austroafricanum]
MLLVDVANASADVAAMSARLAKVARIAELLRTAGRQGDARLVRVVVSWLSGELTQRQIGVGWRSVRSVPDPAAQPSLTVEDVDARFGEIGSTSGKGSQARRAALLAELFAAATAVEQVFLRRLLTGELRQGALGGVMADAVGKAAGVPSAVVRRAAMLGGDLPAVAAAAVTDGESALAQFTLQVGRPVGPMLAQTATGVADALDRFGGTALFEAKLDGARVQIHRRGDAVSVFTRSLDDVTARLPEVVDATLALPVTELIADAEAIALRPDGRPHRFQITASRFGRRGGTPDAGTQRLSVFFFDLLHADGVDLLDLPTGERIATLDATVPREQRVDRLLTSDPEAAQAFLDATLAAGHEGVMAKSPTAPYEAGRRGAGWLKVKPVHTLDLVVLAVEWGSGRRTGKLSNIHLGARDPATGGFVMLGKTFKGMTDEMLAWQTERFLELADGAAPAATSDHGAAPAATADHGAAPAATADHGAADGFTVTVRPEQVVEIAFDGIQTSSRYPGGMALRFARVLCYRDDKTAAEADTIDTVRALHERAN